MVAMVRVAGKITVMESDPLAGRARQRALVRRGYDAISLAYRSDDGNAAASSAEDVRRYAGWVAEMAGLVRPGARVVDLGCGAGIPATDALASHGLQVLRVDFSAVQLHRARRPVPAARFVQADMAALHLRPASADAVVAFYSLIHVPLADQQALFPRIRDWLRRGGYFLAIVGAGQLDRHRAVPRCRHVLGPRRHRHLLALAAGSAADAHLELLYPGRKQRACSRPGRSIMTTGERHPTSGRCGHSPRR
jgi:SAM-dependent methyltransferase